MRWIEVGNFVVLVADGTVRGVLERSRRVHKGAQLREPGGRRPRCEESVDVDETEVEYAK